MSFIPPTSDTKIETSLFGVGDPVKFRFEDLDLRRGEDKPHESTINTIVLIFISAIIFVTVIAIYDIAKNYFNNYYSKRSLLESNNENISKDLPNNAIFNKNNLASSIIFAIFCSLTLIIILIFYFKIFKK